MIVLDESTMISSTTISRIIYEFPDKRIIIIGDIDSNGFNYQCSLSDSLVKGFKHFNPKYFNCQSITYTKNYRFDEELNNKLDKLRHFMKTNKDTPNKEQLLSDHVSNEFSSCFVDKSQINFKDGDMGISALQESKFDFAYSNYFISKGATPIYYNNQTKFNQNIIKSNFSYNKPTHNSYEVRLFETVHACQGKTVPINNNLLIIIESTFDFQLWYTSLSRARTLSQIKIITGF
jgi:5S rRNA maturation endonuclease (ribonuclease M5)